MLAQHFCLESDGIADALQVHQLVNARVQRGGEAVLAILPQVAMRVKQAGRTVERQPCSHLLIHSVVELIDNAQRSSGSGTTSSLLGSLGVRFFFSG